MKALLQKISTLFSVLCTATRKTFPAEAMLEPVPRAPGAYFILTVIRLMLAHARCLPAWMVALSIVVDITVLPVTIWRFHIPHMQPPGFSLKGPTMLYLFGPIALRALRFDPLHVAMAGAVSIIALTRARKQRVRSGAESQAARDLSRFFSPDIARQISHAGDAVKPSRGVSREAAILFVGLRGLTALSARIGPDATVDKFMGDGVMITFGAAATTETHAADALKAAPERDARMMARNERRAARLSRVQLSISTSACWAGCRQSASGPVGPVKPSGLATRAASAHREHHGRRCT